MNIPTVLISNTVAEFKAEGYTAEGMNVNTSGDSTKEYQYITLTFKKEEDKNNG